MILDHVNNLEQYASVPRRGDVVRLLMQTDWAALAAGRHEVDGDDLFYLVNRYATGPWEGGKAEAHETYLDVQVMINGTEKIGFAHRDEVTVSEAYDSQRDVAFFHTPPGMTELILRPGFAAVFWPHDVHLPGRQIDEPEDVVKIVFKIRLPNSRG